MKKSKIVGISLTGYKDNKPCGHWFKMSGVGKVSAEEVIDIANFLLVPINELKLDKLKFKILNKNPISGLDLL